MNRASAALFACMAVLSLPQPARADGFSTDLAKIASGAYRLETAHSQVLFAIPHLALTNYYARFDRISGTLTFNSNTPEKSTVAVAIETASIDTPSTRLNAELSGPAVFDSAKFPEASFKSVSVTRTGATAGTIAGELTIRNVTKPVTLDVEFTGGGPNPMGGSDVLGFHATATIKRSDFGIEGMIWEPMVGDEVKLIIEAMFQHKRT